MTTPAAEALLPHPQRVAETGDGLLLSTPPEIRPADQGSWVRRAVTRLRAVLERAATHRGESLEAGGVGPAAREIRLRVDRGAARGGESYRLSVGPRAIRVTGGGEAGLFYGVMTLVQWLRSRGEPDAAGLRVPGVEIEDWPDFENRGVLLDVSRNRVPTMETLFGLTDLLASWKVNQLQLYTEHTFAYEGHEVVWRDSSPLTAAEVRKLARWCSERFIELVPNQNSFGHFHRWLVHEPYRHLAECPQGVRHPFADEVQPFSLCAVDPGVFELLEDLYDQLLPNFSSGLVNAGLDETFDLGSGRSAEACADRGSGAVYLDFLRRVRQLARERGRRLQFWGDIVLEHPDLVPELPDDVIALVWGYEADHPFAEQCARFAESRLDFYVCPGTSSWNSFGGRAANALENLAAAARAGFATGAAGYLITDWGDNGHLQPLPVSYPALLQGAALAWNAGLAERAQELDWTSLVDRHAFGRRGLGGVARELGNAYLSTGAPIRNGTVLGRLVLSPADDLEHERYERLTERGLRAARDRIGRARSRLTARGLEEREWRWVADVLEFACELGLARLAAGRGAALGSLPAEVRRRLRHTLGPLSAKLPELWLARSRPGGLPASRRALARVADLLAG